MAKTVSRGKKPKGRGKKLTWDDVEAIRKARLEGDSIKSITAKYGISRKTASDIINQRTWRGKKPSPLKGKKTGRKPPNKTIAPKDDWHEKVRQAKQSTKKGGKGKQLTIDQVNAAYAAYVKEQSAEHVARETGINPTTAAKYINNGDPARNIRPFKDRLARVVDRAQEQQDYTLANAREEMQRIARALLMKTAQRIQSLDPNDIKPFLLSKHLKDIQVIIERTMGVADATVKVDSEDRFARWELDELMEFVKTGTVPEHDMMVPGAAKKGKE